MFKVSFHVRHFLIPPFNVTEPTVPFIRAPIGSSSSLCYNERRVYEIGIMFALERNSKVFFPPFSLQTVSLLGLFLAKQGQSIYQLSALLALGLSSGTKWLSCNTTECNLWLSLCHTLSFHFTHISLSTSYSFLLLCIKVFPHHGSCLHTSSGTGFFLHSSSLDSPWITWEKRVPLSSSPLHHSLYHLNHRIHLLATNDLWHQRLAGRTTIESGTGFVPGYRGSREFNEIQTLGMRSYRHLKTSLPLTSAANVWRSKDIGRSCTVECCCTIWMHNDYERQGEVQVRAKDFWRTQIFCKCCQ